MSEPIKGTNTGTFALELTASSGLGLIELLNVATLRQNYNNLESDYYVFHGFFLEALQVTISLPSFTKASLPNLNSYDTEAERQAKIADVQNRFAKLGLSIFIASGGAPYIKRALPVVQNFGSEWYQPLLNYLTTQEICLLGDSDKLAVQVQNLGNGTLGTGDSLVLHGSWRQEITAIERTTIQRLSPTHYTQTVGETPIQLRPANDSRRVLWIQNSGPDYLRVAFGSSSNLAKGLKIGGQYQFDWSNEKYYISDSIWVKSEGSDLDVSIMEASQL